MSFFGLDDEDLSKKPKFVFEQNGQRVRLIADGRTGTIEGHGQGGINTFLVRLDSGQHHLLEVHRTDIEPEDLPYRNEPEPKAEMTPKKIAGYAELLRPFIKASGGLVKALEAGKVSDRDIFLIQRCMSNIEAGRIVTDPYGGINGFEDENITHLKTMCEKYSDTVGADAPLHKAAGGDRVDSLIKRSVAGLRAGKNVILPPECRIPFSRVPALQDLVASGRICFDT